MVSSRTHLHLRLVCGIVTAMWSAWLQCHSAPIFPAGSLSTQQPTTLCLLLLGYQIPSSSAVCLPAQHRFIVPGSSQTGVMSLLRRIGSSWRDFCWWPLEGDFWSPVGTNAAIEEYPTMHSFRRRLGFRPLRRRPSWPRRQTFLWGPQEPRHSPGQVPPSTSHHPRLGQLGVHSHLTFSLFCSTQDLIGTNNGSSTDHLVRLSHY